MGSPQHLEEAITLSGKKKGHLAERLGITRQTFTKKCKNPELFTNLQTEVLCEELNITKLSDKQKIFC